MAESDFASQELDKVAQCTRQYARYSRDAAGLGDVLGGLLFFLTSAWWISYRHLAARVLVIITPLLWIAAKEWLQRQYYQSEGRVEQAESMFDRIALWVFTAFSGGISLAVAYFLATSVPGNGAAAYARAGIALVILLALPLVIGRYLRGGNEYIVGMCLMMHAARAVYGLRIFTNPGPGPVRPETFTTAQTVGALVGFIEVFAALCALVLISEGLKQHFAFRKLRVHLAGLRGQL